MVIFHHQMLKRFDRIDTIIICLKKFSTHSQQIKINHRDINSPQRAKYTATLVVSIQTNICYNYFCHNHSPPNPPKKLKYLNAREPIKNASYTVKRNMQRTI